MGGQGQGGKRAAQGCLNRKVEKGDSYTLLYVHMKKNTLEELDPKKERGKGRINLFKEGSAKPGKVRLDKDCLFTRKIAGKGVKTKKRGDRNLRKEMKGSRSRLRKKARKKET